MVGVGLGGEVGVAEGTTVEEAVGEGLGVALGGGVGVGRGGVDVAVGGTGVAVAVRGEVGGGSGCTAEPPLHPARATKTANNTVLRTRSMRQWPPLLPIGDGIFACLRDFGKSREERPSTNGTTNQRIGQRVNEWGGSATGVDSFARFRVRGGWGSASDGALGPQPRPAPFAGTGSLVVYLFCRTLAGAFAWLPQPRWTDR